MFMRTHSIALVGALAVSGALLALPQQADAQYRRGRDYSEERYRYDYSYRPAPRRYRSEREYSNKRYGTYWDEYGGRPATLGYCQRNPGRCR